MMCRDGKTPQEQKNQILAIQPIFPGSQPANTKYTIPPYHPHHTVDDGNLLLDLSDDISQHSFAPTSSDALAELVNTRCIPALIPTSTGTAVAGCLGNGTRKDRVKDQGEGLHQPREAGFVNTKGNNFSLLD